MIKFGEAWIISCVTKRNVTIITQIIDTYMAYFTLWIFYKQSIDAGNGCVVFVCCKMNAYIYVYDASICNKQIKLCYIIIHTISWLSQ